MLHEIRIYRRCILQTKKKHIYVSLTGRLVDETKFPLYFRHAFKYSVKSTLNDGYLTFTLFIVINVSFQINEISISCCVITTFAVTDFFVFDT